MQLDDNSSGTVVTESKCHVKGNLSILWRAANYPPALEKLNGTYIVLLL